MRISDGELELDRVWPEDTAAQGDVDETATGAEVRTPAGRQDVAAGLDALLLDAGVELALPYGG